MRLEKQTRNRTQRGIAMIMALLALFLLAIIGIAFMTMTNTENSANRNYKDSQKAYFASRAGLESARALMVPPNAITGLGAGSLYAPAIALDGQMPSNTVQSMIYWGNSTDPKAADIDPTAGNTLDDELCQELYGGLGLSAPTQPNWNPQAAAIPCGSTGGAGELLASRTPFAPVISAAGQIPDAGGASALPFKWVRITNKQNFMGLVGQPMPSSKAASTYGYQVCWDGAREQVIAPGQTCAAQLPFEMRPVWLLTSLAITPGGSRRMTQMEVALMPPITVNATVATNGPISLRGSLVVDGDDNCSKSSFNAVYSGACVPGSTDSQGNPCAPAITSSGSSSQNLTGNANVPGVTQGIITTYNPDGTVAQQGTTGQGTWPYHVDDLINAFKQIAQPAAGAPWNFKCPNANCGTQTNQKFGNFPTNPLVPATGGPPIPVYIPGSVTLHGNATSGDGILIVDGDLTVDGGLQYYGLILVKGQIHFTGGGSASVNLYGAILAGDKVNATDTIGGSFNFHYSSCALRQNAPQVPPKVLASHEVIF